MEDNLMEMNLSNDVVNIVEDVVDNSNIEETIDTVTKTNKGGMKFKGIIIGSLIGIGGTILYKKVIKPRILAKKGIDKSKGEYTTTFDDEEKNEDNVIDINEVNQEE